MILYTMRSVGRTTFSPIQNNEIWNTISQGMVTWKDIWSNTSLTTA
jgi:hypothetical protein